MFNSNKISVSCKCYTSKEYVLNIREATNVHQSQKYTKKHLVWERVWIFCEWMQVELRQIHLFDLRAFIAIIDTSDNSQRT